jgi:hypothetical protein
LKTRIPLDDKFVSKMLGTKGKNCGYRELLSFLVRYPEWFEPKPMPNLASKKLPKKVTVKVLCGERVVSKPSFENPHSGKKDVPSTIITEFFDLLMDNGVMDRE